MTNGPMMVIGKSLVDMDPTNKPRDDEGCTHENMGDMGKDIQASVGGCNNTITARNVLIINRK